MRLIYKLFLLALAAFIPAVTTWASEGDTGWIMDERGCKVANPLPQPNESITWSGECQDGFAGGEGVLIFYVDGTPHSRYEGTLVRGWAEGQGTLDLPDGSRYQGGWERSMENGLGRREWADGSWYDGQWKDGEPHGSGQYRRPDGRVFMGRWNEGVFEGDDGEPEEEESYDPNRT